MVPAFLPRRWRPREFSEFNSGGIRIFFFSEKNATWMISGWLHLDIYIVFERMIRDLIWSFVEVWHDSHRCLKLPCLIVGERASQCGKILQCKGPTNNIDISFFLGFWILATPKRSNVESQSHSPPGSSENPRVFGVSQEFRQRFRTGPLGPGTSVGDMALTWGSSGVKLIQKLLGFKTDPVKSEIVYSWYIFIWFIF